MEWTIELTGSGLEKPTVFAYEQLARMEMRRLDNVLLQMTHYPDRMTCWRGPGLDGLLETARIKAGPMIVTLEASDGYRVCCPLGDLKSAVVALQDGEGRWLAEVGGESPVRLVPPHKTGDYWVSSLRRIMVEPLADPGWSE